MFSKTDAAVAAVRHGRHVPRYTVEIGKIDDRCVTSEQQGNGGSPDLLEIAPWPMNGL